MMLTRLFAIIVKELRQLRRDRVSFALIVGIPTIQILLFGFAINLDVRGLRAGVLDQAATVQSRELISGLAATGVIEIKHYARAQQDIDRLMQHGDISIALVVPEDFETRLARRDRPAIQVIVDGSDQVIQAAARQLASYPVYSVTGWTRRIQPIEVVNLYNPERRAPINTVPGLIGVILSMTMVLFTAVALVRERERGNLEMLIATPVSPWELTAGKVLPFVFIGLVQVTLVLLLGRLVFHVPSRGAIGDIYLAALTFILASLSLGVFLSTLARSQFQAIQLAFFTFLPQILMSGFMFPFAGMPVVAQYLAEVLPMTHFMRLIRGIMLRGAELSELWPDLAALILFSVVFLTISTLRVHKRLD